MPLPLPLPFCRCPALSPVVRRWMGGLTRGLVLTVGLSACAGGPAVVTSGSPQARALVPTEAWLDGPPPPVQGIDRSLSRLLLPVPPALDRGLVYKAQPGRYVFAQRLVGGAVLYARYADGWHLPLGFDPAGWVDRVYRPALRRQLGPAAGVSAPVVRGLPLGDAWVIEAASPTRRCAAFFAPLRMGRVDPGGTGVGPGAGDAYLRGALCQPAAAGAPWPILDKLLRSAVFREEAS